MSASAGLRTIETICIWGFDDVMNHKSSNVHLQTPSPTYSGTALWIRAGQTRLGLTCTDIKQLQDLE